MSLSRYFLYNFNITNGSLTNTNVISTNITSTTLLNTNQISTNITTATLNASTGITTATLNASTGINATTITAATSRITTSLLAVGNSNTVGNIFTTGGNVGIGTTSPGAMLDINGTSLYRNGNGSGSYTNNQLTFGFNGTATYRHAIKSRHDAGSNAGNAFDFYVWQTSDNLNTVGTKRIMSTTGDAMIIGETLAFLSITGGDKFIVHANGVNGGSGYFYYNSGNAFGTASDRRLKENINPLNKTDALNFIMKLAPVEFNMKNQTGLQAGFIAQDVLSSCTKDSEKSAVAKWETYNDSDPECPLLGVSDRPLVSNLVAALQVVNTELESMKTELELEKTLTQQQTMTMQNLETRITSLEARLAAAGL
jgi:hypothetical protein